MNYPEKHGFKPLWDGSEPAPTASGKRPAFASGANGSGGADPNARGNGSNSTIPNPDDKSTLKAFPLPGDAIEFLSDRQIEAGPLASMVVSVEGDTVHLLVNVESVWSVEAGLKLTSLQG